MRTLLPFKTRSIAHDFLTQYAKALHLILSMVKALVYLQSMKTTTYAFLFLLFTILAILLALWFESQRPDHYFNSVTRFLRSNVMGQKYTRIVASTGSETGIFLFGEDRSIVENELRNSSFQSTNGTVFYQPQKYPGFESWYRRDQRSALYHFSVFVKFDDEGKLIEGYGMYAGPTWK